jgi:P pilus assembly chaperone PapD
MKTISKMWNSAPALLVGMVICFFMSGSLAHGASKTLMINPFRVVFEGRTRTATVNVANTNQTAVRYRVCLVTMKKNAKGGLAEVEAETHADKLAKSLIRFSPRQAIIQPGQRQVVKLMVRKPADLPFGEYQTRLKFMPIADNVPETTENRMESAGPKLDIDLIVGVTIPVVVQHGQVNSKVVAGDMAIKPYPKVPSGYIAMVSLLRTGDYSAFGDIIVRYLGKSGEDRVIAKGEDVGIYIPDATRTVALPVELPKEIDFTSGKIRVEFLHNKQIGRPPVKSFKELTLTSRN